MTEGAKPLHLRLCAIFALCLLAVRPAYGAVIGFDDFLIGQPLSTTLQPTDSMPVVQGGETRQVFPHSSFMRPDASNASLPDALNNLGLSGFGGFTANSDTVAATMLCTTTIASLDVAGCSATTGLAVGNVLTGPGIPAATLVAGSITATSFRMTAAAGAGAGAGLVSARPSYWTDIDGSAATAWRLSGRLMVGNAVGRAVSRFGVTSYDFCPTAAYCENWGPRDAQLAVMSQAGGPAIWGASRASLGQNVEFGVASIGIAGSTVNDYTINKAAWAGYLYIQHDNTVADAKSWGLEISPKNKGLNGTTNPYHEQQGPTGIALRAGADGSVGGEPTQPVNAAILIGPGTGLAGNYTNYTFNTGIVFMKNGLTGNDGTTGLATAIDMPRGDLIQWRAPNQELGAYIYGDVTDNTKQQSIVFTDDKTSIRGPSGLRILDILHEPAATAVNYHTLKDGATGVSPQWSCTGSDTDVGCRITTKGSGSIFLDGNVTAASSITAGTGGALQWPSRARMFSPSDGVIQLTDNAITSFQRMQFGGAAATFPAIKRSGAGFHFRLADDSAWADLTALKLTLTTQLLTPGMASDSGATTGTLCWTTGTGNITVNTTVACLASDERLKDIAGGFPDAGALVGGLKPIVYKWRAGTPKTEADPGEHFGLGAFATGYVDERLIARDAEGNPSGWRQDAMISLLVANAQEQHGKIDRQQIYILLLTLWCGLLSIAMAHKPK